MKRNGRTVQLDENSVSHTVLGPPRLGENMLAKLQGVLGKFTTVLIIANTRS